MDYKEVYQNFWKDIVEDKNGELILDQVQRELADYRILLNEAPKVYEEVSGLTQPLTKASAVIASLNDNYIYKKHALEDMTEMANEDGMISLKTIKEYLR